MSCVISNKVKFIIDKLHNKILINKISVIESNMNTCIHIFKYYMLLKSRHRQVIKKIYFDFNSFFNL